MSVEAVKEYLKPFGLSGQVLELAESSATVELAAHALGTQPARIAKTLSFLVGEEAILIVAAGDAKIDNAKYKAQFHQKAKMLTPPAGAGAGGPSRGRGVPLRHPGGRSRLPGRKPQALRDGVPRLRQRQFRHPADHPPTGGDVPRRRLGGCVQGLLKKERASRPLLFLYPSKESLEAAPTWVAYFPVKHPVHRPSLLPRQASSSPSTLM